MPFKMSSGVLTALDIYGSPIGVNHAGSSAYKTRLGSLMTLLTYALMLVNFINLATQFSTRSAQIESSQLVKEMHRNTTAVLAD